ncbi:MAG: exosortase/archaeosortase family protein [Methanobacteriota archaeon]|nr:MAG: exosortase/archaeosortase family protein [Euryarchaeota archaeon]
MNVLSLLDSFARQWNRAVLGNRETLFLITVCLSSLIAFVPFARETSVSSFFIYALLPIIIVIANREKTSEIPVPSGIGLGISAFLVIGSFALNFVTGSLTGDYTYGLTDYVILVAGIFSAFYSIESAVVRTGILILFALRAMTLALSFVYSSAFVSVSDFFVSVVVAFSRIFVSQEIGVGPIAGEIIVGGEAGASSVFIGWACAGLEELALISVILYLLITSFELGRRKVAFWLVIGIAGSFVINIARMVILVWVAHSRGIDTMLWVHTHLGDVLFLVWIALFWLLFFRFCERGSASGDHG